MHKFLRQKKLLSKKFVAYSIVSLLALFSFLSLRVGYVNIDFFSAIINGISGQKTTDTIILFELRLPRTLMCLIVGAGLGLAGAALQGYLRNPLAEPSIVGISSSAALGAVLCIGLGINTISFFYTPIFALSFAMVACLILIKLTQNTVSRHSVILIGVGISALSGSLTTLILSLSDNPFAINEIVFWMLGSVTDVSYFHVLLAGPMVLVGSVFLLRCASDLNLLSLGEETASSTGVNIGSLRLNILFGTALIVGGTTSVTGIVGFVGLVTPHMVRPFVNYEPKKTLIWTPPIAALLILVSDIAIRILPTTGEIKLGVLTALLGTPFFLYLIGQQRD